MLITRVSQISGIERVRDLKVTQNQIDAWQRRELIQNVMPHLSLEDREFLLSGSTQEEWDEIFPDIE